MSINSKIKVDQIESYDPPNAAVELTQGATIPVGKTLSIQGNTTLGIVTCSSVTVTNNITVTGTISGTFSGDATNLTTLPVTQIGKTIAHVFIL